MSHLDPTRHQYYVYIMSSHRRTLYVGVTNNLAKRVGQHKTGSINGFTKRYNVNRLVYAESSLYIEDALNREKEIKGWRREKKIQHILELNPEWNDLALEWELTGG